jgi:hypothetical protein
MGTRSNCLRHATKWWLDWEQPELCISVDSEKPEKDHILLMQKGKTLPNNKPPGFWWLSKCIFEALAFPTQIKEQ